MLGRKIKEKRGITLIALVITIIIMLILVTVTINLTVTGGLFEYARKSTVEFDTAKEKELIEQAKMLAMIENKDAVIKKSALDNKLEEVIGKDNYKASSTEKGINVTFEGSGREYLIKYDNQIQPEYFYVYKCSDCSVERIPITNEIETNGYDITQKVSPDRYYEGYYSKYNGTKTDVTSLEYDNNIAIDEAGETYDGSSLRNRNDEKFWTVTDACTQSGYRLIPEDGKTYYLYEVPKAFLNLRIMIRFDQNDHNKIIQIIPFVVIDNYFHKARGIDVGGTETNEVKYSLGNSYTVANGNVVNTLSYRDFPNITRGGLFYTTDLLKSIYPDLQFTFTPYWITMDGVKVCGPTRTFNTGNDGNGYCIPETFHEVTN